jgi:hypothetical protein
MLFRKSKKNIMEFIRTIREKQQTKRQAEIERQAEEFITLQDFDNELFIAYNGTPLAPIDPSWTTKEIVQQLSVFRTNYINSKIKNQGLC